MPSRRTRLERKSVSDTSGKAGGLENHGLLKAGRWDCHASRSVEIGPSVAGRWERISLRKGFQGWGD
jgi:hypothetical protein